MGTEFSNASTQPPAIPAGNASQAFDQNALMAMFQTMMRQELGPIHSEMETMKSIIFQDNGDSMGWENHDDDAENNDGYDSETELIESTPASARVSKGLPSKNGKGGRGQFSL